MTPEGRVKKAIKKVFAKYGVWYFMPANNGFGVSGVSDFIALLDGVMWSIEAKSNTGNTTGLQDAHLSNTCKNGGLGIVVDEDGLPAFEHLIMTAAIKRDTSGAVHNPNPVIVRGETYANYVIRKRKKANSDTERNG